MIIRVKAIRKLYPDLTEDKIQKMVEFMVYQNKVASVDRRNDLRKFYGWDGYWQKPYPLARDYFRKIRRKRIMIKKSKQLNRRK